jgi:hypothetical protein
VDVYEDPTTPENDVFFRLRNGLDVPLYYNGEPLDHSQSSLVDLQFDTGSLQPSMFSELSIWSFSGDVKIQMNAPGNPSTLLDQSGSISRIAWSGEYAFGRKSTSVTKTDGVNPAESLTLRAVLAPGVTFADVIAALDRGMSSAYVAGHFGEWTTAQKQTYRAEAPKGLRIAILMQSIVPNAWNPDGHGLYVTRGRAAPPVSAPVIESATALPATLLDTQASQLSVTATDPQPGPSALSYLWTVVSGGGSISGAASASATYTPANVTGTQAVVVRVAVSDGVTTVTRDVTLQVNDANAPPPNVPPQITAATATPSTIWDNQQSQLVVTASDSDGPSALSYQWTVLGGGGSLSSATSASPWYTPGDVIGTQTVTLRVTVSDGAASVSRDVSLTVQDANPPPPGAVLLTEGFGAGVPTGWSYYDEGTISAPSNWRVVGGELAQQSNIRDEGTANDLAKRGTYLLNEDGLGWTSYKAKFKLRSTDDDTLGLMFRYIDEDNWYRFSWDAQLKQRRLVKKAGGAYTLLAADNVPYVVGRSYQVEVVAQNSQLEVWIDGMRVLQANDASHNRGSVAFYTWQNNGAYFDDLVIEDLSGGAFNVLPKITALSATPAAILDNQQSQLAVTASDSDGPSALSYQWAVLSGGGSLSGANSASPMYTPSDVVGTQTVTLRVTVSDGAASVNRDLTVSVQDANPPPLGPLLLAQDFSAGVPADWSYYDEGTISAPSKWRVVSGELAQQSNIRDESTANSLVKRGTYLLYEAGDAWRDYRAKFKLRSSDDDTLGAMFRFIDANNYYRFSWDAQLKQRQLVKKVGGVYTLLAADSVPYVVGRNYQVEIVAKGGQLEVWVDGARVFQISDASLPSGTFGFYTWQNNGAFFDDLQVNASP